MRPGRFHPGNSSEIVAPHSGLPRFNEAGAFPPRKSGYFCSFKKGTQALQ